MSMEHHASSAYRVPRPDSEDRVRGDRADAAAIALATVLALPAVAVAPVAFSDFVLTGKAEPVLVTLTASDDDGDPLTYTVVSGPAHGTLTGTAPFLVYTPDPGFTGLDSFTWVANDGALDSNVATTTVTVVGAVNGPPVAAAQADC